MAISRASKSSIQQAFPKQQTIWDQTSSVAGMDALASTTLTSATSSVTFSNIPQTYTHLQLRISAKFVSNSEVDLQFNGDTGNYYYSHFINGNGSTTGSANTVPYTQAYIGWSLASASVFPTMIVDILDYTNTNKYKTVRNFYGNDYNTGGSIMFLSNHWRSTAAINTIKFFGGVNIEANSVISLYGIK